MPFPLYQLPHGYFFMSLMKELCSSKDAAAANEQRLSAEIMTVSFLKKIFTS